MADPAVGQPDPAAAELLSSVMSHPGLQETQAPDGSAQPAADPAASRFLETFSGQPAPTQNAPEAAPAQEQPGPTNGQAPTGGRLYAGKYRNVEELERAALEKDRTLREREAELRAARAVNQHLEEVFAPLRTQREERRPAVPVTFDERNNPVVDPEAFMAAIEERARAIAREQVQETLRPLSAMSNASAKLRGDYPELLQQEGQFAQWLSANPDMQERVSRDPDFYLEGAYLKFSRDLGHAQQTQNREAASAAQEQVRQARANAGPAGGSPMGSRRGTEQDAMTSKLTSLYKYGQETGNWKPYKDARLEMALGQPFLDTMERSSWGR